jgi:hypothetical protein
VSIAEQPADFAVVTAVVLLAFDFGLVHARTQHRREHDGVVMHLVARPNTSVTRRRDASGAIRRSRSPRSRNFCL